MASSDDHADLPLTWSPRVERLRDATDGAERWRLHHPGGGHTDYRESWRASWGRPPERWPANLILDDSSPKPTTARSKVPGGIWRDREVHNQSQRRRT